MVIDRVILKEVVTRCSLLVKKIIISLDLTADNNTDPDDDGAIKIIYDHRHTKHLSYYIHTDSKFY